MERKTNKKWGRLGSVHHTCMSGNQVDVGEEGAIFKYVPTKLERKFLTGQDE